MRLSSPALSLALSLACGLTACGRAPDAAQDLDALDRELTAANGTAARDPAIAQAVQAPIMVDPTLAQQANANALRPPPRPDPGAVPADIARPDPVDPRTLRPAPAASTSCPQCRTRAGAYTLGALAAADPATAACARVSYSAGWANRLPADLPLYPDARVIEAAGNAGGTCRLRIVTFASSAAPTKLIDWYFAQTRRAGYAAERRTDGNMQVLGGTRGAAAYMLYVTPRAGGGATVDLMTNTGQ